MKTSSIILIVVLVILVVVGVWFFITTNQGQPSVGPATYAPTSTTSVATIVAASVSPSLGNYLTATNGMTLYKYTKDTPGSGVSTCTGQCLIVWPAYTLTSSSSLAGASIPAATGTFGYITRSDGTLQLTYDGYPLYFYDKDVNPGDTNGQNVGGVWFVVNL